MAQASAGDGTVLADFDGGAFEPSWQVVNDGVMGGRSSGGFAIEDGVLRFSGTLNTNGGGFASIRTRAQALHLEAYAAIALRVRGDGRAYQFRLNRTGSEVAQKADFNTRAGEWQEVVLPFELFAPRRRGRPLAGNRLQPETIDSYGVLIADGVDGPFVLEVDWIRAVPEQ